PFWQSPECIGDFQANGAAGKKWTAAHAAAASVNKGDQVPATPEEMQARNPFRSEQKIATNGFQVPQNFPPYVMVTLCNRANTNPFFVSLFCFRFFRECPSGSSSKH